MSFNKKPQVHKINNNDKIWSQSFNLFNAKVYVPESTLPYDVINFGFSAPCFLILTDYEFSDNEILDYAQATELKDIASEKAGSIIFINPLTDGGWKNADENLFIEIIENTKIHQYYEDGIAILNNRFFHKNEGYAIRGAIFRTCLITKGDSADYAAKNLLKTIQGTGLWGPADIIPTCCVLENLSVKPAIQRRDMPIVSAANSDDINTSIKNATDYCLIQEKSDIKAAYTSFIRKYMRWGWTGDLQQEVDFDEIGMIEEPCVTELKTSPDNSGDDAGTEKHKVGYISYYNKDLFSKGPSPLMLCFHGGGDSAKHIAQTSAWYKVAHDHNFLLVCVENHINSTATEMMELIEILKKQYKIDSTRIYASGFSMGGCKSWDLYQEYPEVFAGLAPMDATFEYGLNLYGQTSPGLHGSGTINQNVMVPVFYTGGEVTPLPELPFQAKKCVDRFEYVLKVNQCKLQPQLDFEKQEVWENKIWGINGNRVIKADDTARNAVLTMQCFESEDDNIYTVFGSISGQGHECRYHTCECAWNFLKKFRRIQGKIIIEE